MNLIPNSLIKIDLTDEERQALDTVEKILTDLRIYIHNKKIQKEIYHFYHDSPEWSFPYDDEWLREVETFLTYLEIDDLMLKR